MSIHKEGYLTIVYTAALIAGLDLIFYFSLHAFPLLVYALWTLSAVFLFFVVRFFRDPRIVVNKSDQGVLSPADGTVVAIEKMKDDEYFNDERMQVSVFMSPLNIHVNRYPVSGEVMYFKHHNGHFHVAWNPKSSKENEHTSTVIRHGNGSDILFKQIAGAVARRIISYAEISNQVSQGQQCGFIKFGSRVDVLLPLDSEVLVNLGDKVLGGRTVLASLK